MCTVTMTSNDLAGEQNGLAMDTETSTKPPPKNLKEARGQLTQALNQRNCNFDTIKDYITAWKGFLNAPEQDDNDFDYWSEVTIVFRTVVRAQPPVTSTCEDEDHNSGIQEIAPHVIEAIANDQAMECFIGVLQERLKVKKPDSGVLDKWETLSILFIDSESFGDLVIPILSEEKQSLASLRHKILGDMNTLQYAIHVSCTRLVERMVKKITEDQRYVGKEHLRRKVMTALDGSRRNCLHLAIQQLNAGIVNCLLRAECELVKLGGGNQATRSATGPLHLLFQTICEAEEIPKSQECCEILQAIVHADVNTLKTECEVISDQLFSEPVKLTPYKLLLMLHEAKSSDLQQSETVIKKLEERRDILRELKVKVESLIWSHFEGSDLREAGLDQYKLTDLPLSDFDTFINDQQCNDISVFAKNFVPNGVLQLPTRLSRLVLPTLSPKNSAVATESIKLLVQNLRDEFKVEQIIRLIGRDSMGSFLDDNQIALWVEQFQVERLNWPKHDFDISTLQKRADKIKLRSLLLHTTGHWGVIYHWLSQDGLLAIPNLEDVDIYVERRDPSEREARRCEKVVVKAKALLQKTESSMQTRRNSARIKIETALPWRPRKPAGDAQQTLNDRFNSYIEGAQNALKTYWDSENGERWRNSIAVALLDNGVSSCDIQNSLSVTQGHSVVYEVDEITTLPWFTSRDNHGTHMADLITRVNPYGELWAYRINVSQADIKIDRVLEALSRVTAGSTKPDIINLSWSVPEHDERLEKKLEEISNDQVNPTLVFCAKSPNPFASHSYPADYTMTISVDYAAQYPRASRVSKLPDIVVLGENMAVESPAYALHQEAVASGSSVATALASGMASLILMFAKNWEIPNWQLLKSRKNMLELFNRFKIDRSNMQPFVDPKMLFSKPEDLKTEIQSVLNWCRNKG